MGDKYGVAILGAGWVAGEYVKAFRDHPKTELIGIYNRTPGKATRLLQAHGVSAREYESADQLFDDDRVQIIASCTSPNVRPEHIVRAARTGRHVVIEKPIALRRSKPGAFIFPAVNPRTEVQKSSPSVHLLKTNLMSKALPRPASTLKIFSSEKPFAASVW